MVPHFPVSKDFSIAIATTCFTSKLNRLQVSEGPIFQEVVPEIVWGNSVGKAAILDSEWLTPSTRRVQ